MQQNLQLKKTTGVDTSELAKKINLSNLKSEIDKLDTDKLKTVPTELRRINNVV